MRFSWTFDQDVTLLYLNRPLTITLKLESPDCTDPNTCPNPYMALNSAGRGMSGSPDEGHNRFYLFNAPPNGFGNPAARQETVIFDAYPEAGFDINLLFYQTIPAASGGSFITVAYRYQGEVGARSGGSFAGQWNTNFGTFTGPVIMTVNGNNVTGSYSNADGTFKGAFTCTVSGNTCTGNFSDPVNSGTIVLTLSGDGGSFTAAWSSTNGNGNKGTWSGTLSSPSTCTGACSLSPTGQPIGAGGGPGSVGVTTSSSWTAVPIDPWIHITSGSSGSGNGTVNFTVDPTTGPPRSGTISIAGQTATVFQNGTPSGTTAGCNYLIQSGTTQSVGVGGANGLIQIVTAQNCAWTSSVLYPGSSGGAWLTINSGSSAVGNGAVSYIAATNNTGNPRSASIVIAGQNVVINQDGGVPPGTPAIGRGGIVNAASYAPGGPPNGLAQGSFFSIFGTNLGPDPFVKVSDFPLPTSAGGVSVQIVQGSTTYNAPLIFVSSTQINGILPSNLTLGNAQVIVNYNGKSSQLANIQVSPTSLGVFYQAVNGNNLAIAQNVVTSTDYRLNLPSVPAKPGQIVIFWGTGLGPINGGDNVPPGKNAGDLTNLPVTITVGGVTAQRLYAGRQSQFAGVDNVYITIPTGVPFGCQVPVAITAGGVPANTTMIAITADGSACQ